MLKRVRIKNYKSLDVDVELDPITVLIGKSGTGKTNFVEALRFLRDSVRTRVTHLYPVFSKTAALPFTVAFDIEFCTSIDREDLQYHLELGPVFALNHFQSSVVEEYLIANGVRVLHQVNDAWQIRPENEIQAGTIALGHRIADLTARRARAFLKNLGCYSFPASSPMRGRGGEYAGLRDTGENLGTILDQILDDPSSPFDRIARALRLLNPSILELDAISSAQSQIKIRHAIQGGVLELDLADESQGLGSFLACMAALYQRPSKEVIVIEEPENGIHPGALATLAEEFKACPEEGRGQVILTTHSPQFLDNFDIENVRLVEIDTQGVTRINRLADDQIDAIKDGLMSPGELFTVDEARSGAIIEPEA